MDKKTSAPLLSRIKSWQFVGLGISGWCTLYSVALITWSSALIGNVQGGCFAATMTLAGREAKRFQRSVSGSDPLAWAAGVSTDQVNQAFAQALQKAGLRVEACHATEAKLGFGVRVVVTGRTLVYETGRWQEPVIDLAHAEATEENRKKVSADMAFIVGVGRPDEAAQVFAQSHPVDFFVGEELEDLLKAETPPAKKLDSA